MIHRSVYTILLPARTPLHLAENTLLKPTAVTGAYTESTVKPRTTLADPLSKSHHTQNPLCARTPLHPAENTLLKPTAVTGAYTESTVKPRTTLADPLSKSHPVQNPLHRSELPVQAIQTEPSLIQFQNSDDYNHLCTSILNRLQN